MKRYLWKRHSEMQLKINDLGPEWDHECSLKLLAFTRSDLSGGGDHVLAGLGDGSSGGHFSVYTCGILRGLLSAPGGGIPAGWGDHALVS